MKKIIFLLMAAALMVGCQNDDTDFSAYINGTASTANLITIVYSNSSVSVAGDSNGYVTVSGTDVTVNTGTDTDSLLLILSGSCSDGSLLIYRQKKFGILLNGLTLNNGDGPAINNQCGKSLYLYVNSGTTNTLTDGTSYTEQSYDQKGALFSEGQVYVMGTGTLNVTGNCKHGFACDDYIVIDDGVTLNVSSTAGNGIKVNDGLWINNGTLDISVTADAARGIKCDSVVVITGGTTTISTSGDCVYDSDEQDYSSAACIKCDYDFTMSGGTLTMTSSGDGGKGINCSTNVKFSGGTLSAITTGDNENGKPKAVKGDTGIIVSGGSFTAKVDKSWACDNGSDSDEPADHLTIVGTPKTSSITKKSVVITY
jgi:hypothetical protein